MARWNNPNCGFQKGHKSYITEDSKKIISKKLTGLKRSLKQRRRMSETAKKYECKPPSRKGIKHSEETKIKMKEHSSQRGKPSWNKGKHHSEESKRKLRETALRNGNKPPVFIGEKHWNWKGGISFEPYSTDWTATLRRSIRERDHYTCQLCQKPQGDRVHSVHHIDYDKKNCSPENLLTLCIGCNTKVNTNRNYWTKYFKTIGNHTFYKPKTRGGKNDPE